MTIKVVRKIGFFTALTMLLGTVVGIGIFFKNGSVSRATNGNGVAWLMAWIIGGITSLAAAISFSEIGTMKHKKMFSISAWSDKVIGKKFSYFVRFNYGFFYFALLCSVLGFFASEAIILFIFTIKSHNFSEALAAFQKDIPIYAHVIFGLFITISFLLINFISIKTSGIIQVVTTILKFIPLLVAIIVGLVLPTTHHAGGSSAFKHGSFTMMGLFAALPAVLFAYDAFLIVAQISDKVQGGERKTSWIVFVGMVIITLLYTLIGLSSILHNKGDVGSLISDSLPAQSSRIVTIIVFGFIVIATLGVMNGLSIGVLAIFEQNVKTNTFVGNEKLVSKIGQKNTKLFYSLILIIFWSIVFGSLAIAFKTDAFADGFSNFPTLFFFLIYAIIIFVYTLKRKKMDSKKMLWWIFYPFAILASILITIIVSYSLYIFISGIFVNNSNSSSWGLFAAGKGLTLFDQGILFLALLTVFFSFPYLNLFLKMKLEKRLIKQKDIK